MLSTLRTLCPNSVLLENEPMREHTTFKIGGPARYFLHAGCEQDLCAAADLARAAGLPLVILGCGSNLLVSDAGLDALVAEIGAGMSKIEVDGNRVTAQAGARLSALSLEACRAGLAGLEFASGIPGSVGGGVAMNAGAYGGQMGDALLSVRLLEGGEILELPAAQMELGYRASRALKRKSAVLSATFELTPGDPAEISARMGEYNRCRRERQPLSYPSAGSVFKRPPGHFAGALIEKAGLKGAREGGAAVSELHAGFIINLGGATAADVRRLIRRVQDAVYAMSGVRLEPEIRMLGDFAEG